MRGWAGINRRAGGAEGVDFALFAGFDRSFFQDMLKRKGLGLP
jgi:hypothetical protein